jgi:XapX domain-containing protein
MKAALGIIIGFALGFGCRYFGIPSPAPPVFTGALLVVAMTIGYTMVGHLMTTRAAKAAKCAASTGSGIRAPQIS